MQGAISALHFFYKKTNFRNMKILIKIFLFIAIVYVLILVVLYFLQEKLLFFPTKLDAEYEYKFEGNFEEKNIEVEKGVFLNTLLFKAEQSKGVVLFLHGNGGALNGWGMGSDVYIKNNYDVFYVDYRSYGKSNGKISSENQLVNDAQIMYDYLKTKYDESKIIISGTSMGTGIASRLAVENNPKKLLLNAPYYTLKSLAQEKVPIVPGFILKYKFETAKHLKEVDCPIFIFHGNEDQLIPVKHAGKLKRDIPKLELYILKDYGHNDVDWSPVYDEEMRKILN